MKNMLYIWSLFMCIHLYSQTTKPVNVDSLNTLNKVRKLTPEGKSKLYDKLFEANCFKDKSKALKYNDSLFAVSKLYSLNSGIGNYYQNTAFVRFTELDYNSALLNCKKAITFFLKEKNFNDYLFSISLQCTYLNYLNRNEESFQLALKNINLYKKYPDLVSIGDLYLNVSEQYYLQKKYNNAIVNINLALNIFQKAKSYTGILECDVSMGIILFELEKYSDAIKYFSELINLSEEVSDNDAYKMIYYSYMTKCYNKMNNNLETIKFSKKALSYFKKAKLGLYVIEMQLCKADAYQKLGNNKDAINEIKIVEQNIKKYLSEPDIDLSLKYINQIKANIFIANKQYNLALQTLQKNLKFNDVDIQTYEEISKIQFKLKRYNEAFENLQFFNKKKIERLTVNQKNNLDELQLLYNSKDKEFKIQDLKLKKAKDELQLNDEKNFSNKIIVALVLLLLLLVFLYYNFRVKNKVGQILRYKNGKLEDINLLLNKSNKEKEVLLKEVHHRVKNNLQLVSSILYIQANDTPDISVSEFLDECLNRISSISLIHQNLYLSEDIDKVGFQKYLEELVGSIITSFSEKDRVSFMINANETRLNIETSISLGLIISELTCNSIKHAFKDRNDGIIFLEINKIGDTKYELIAGDNGCGNLSQSDSSISIGLELVRLLVMQLEGEIEKLDRQGSYYKITFEEILN